MSKEEQALLFQLATKKRAAEQVFKALQRAEHAATAAASASGTSSFELLRMSVHARNAVLLLGTEQNL